MSVAFVVGRLARMDETWTTVHLAHAALTLGREVRLFEAADLELSQRGVLTGRAVLARPPAPSLSELVRTLIHQGARRHLDLCASDLVLLRVNPLPAPLLALMLLAESKGAHLVNAPSGIALTRSKAWLASLPPDIPRPATLITGSIASAQLFAGNRPGHVVVKPTVGSGGHGVWLVRSDSPGQITRAMRAAQEGDDPVVIQEYLDEAKDGEKRLVWVDGEIVSAYLRKRTGQEFRHNLKQGATAEPSAVTEQDRDLGRALSPHLLGNGIRLAGLDVIGGRLVEVNTLNPGGVHSAARFGQDDAAKRIIASLLSPRHPSSEAFTA